MNGYRQDDRRHDTGAGGFVSMARPLVWGLVAIGLAVWSLLAWGAYGLADGLIGWGAANAGAAVEGGKDLATAAGVGKPVGQAVEALNLGGLAGQGLDLLRTLLGPVIIGVWAIGAAVTLAVPWLLSRFGGLLAGRFRRTTI